MIFLNWAADLHPQHPDVGVAATSDVLVRYRDIQRYGSTDPTDAWEILSGACLAARKKLAVSLGIPDKAQHLVFTRGTLDGLTMLLGACAPHQRPALVVPGMPVVTTDVEYADTYRELCGRFDVRICSLLHARSQREIVDAIVAACVVFPRPKLLLVSHVSMLTGMVLPIRSIVVALRSELRDESPLIVVDGAQALGNIHTDLRQLDCDIYLGCFHKWMQGPALTGFLYARDRDHVVQLAHRSVHRPAFAPEIFASAGRQIPVDCSRSGVLAAECAALDHHMDVLAGELALLGSGEGTIAARIRACLTSYASADLDVWDWDDDSLRSNIVSLSIRDEDLERPLRNEGSRMIALTRYRPWIPGALCAAARPPSVVRLSSHDRWNTLDEAVHAATRVAELWADVPQRTAVSPGAPPAGPNRSTSATRTGPRVVSWLSGASEQRLFGLLAGGGSDVISLAIAGPSRELLPSTALAHAYAELLHGDASALQLEPEFAPLKQQIVDLMATRGVTCSPDQIVLTTGAQQGLDLLCRLLVDPGASIVTDEVTYPGLVQAVQPFSPRLVALRDTGDGRYPLESLRALLEGGLRPAFVYTIPDGHNPLGYSLSAEDRVALAALANEFGIVLVEDDAYGFLSFGPHSPTPLVSLHPDRVCYIGTFSKMLGPALRTGWLIVPRTVVAQVAFLKRLTDTACSTLAQRAIARFLSASLLEDHLHFIRGEYSRRRDLMIAALRRHFEPEVATWRAPNAGLVVWLRLMGIDTEAMLPEAVRMFGIKYAPGAMFCVGEPSTARSCVRLAFSGPLDLIDEGVQRLARAVHARLA